MNKPGERQETKKVKISSDIAKHDETDQTANGARKKFVSLHILGVIRCSSNATGAHSIKLLPLVTCLLTTIGAIIARF